MSIEIPRKRRKQIKKLKGKTASLLGEQRKVLEHANAILTEAREHAADAARKDFAPRVQNAIDNGLRPAVATGVHAATSAAQNASHRFQSEVVPGLISTAGSVLSVGDLAKDPRVQKIVKEAQKRSKTARKAAGKYVPAVAPKKGIGFGGVALIIVGVVAVAGAAYAAYQTLRADDDLWVADDADTAEKPAA